MVIAFLTMLPIRFYARERIVYERKDAVTLGSLIQAVTRNKYLMIFYLAFMIMICMNTSSTVGTFFATYNLGNFELFSAVSISGLLPILIIPAFLPALVRRFGKKSLFIQQFSGL